MEKFEHGGNVYDLPPKDLLDFSANINPLGISEKVKSEIESQIENLIHYPEPRMTDLKRTISNRYKISEDRISCYNGATEFFYLAMQILKPNRVLILDPSFSEYERSAIASGAKIERLSFSAPIQILTQKIRTLDESDTIVIGNPNNPTGTFPPIEKIIEAARKIHAWIIVDESFLDFRRDSEDLTARRFDYDRLSIVTSLTKFYAIPGLRIGFAITNPEFRNRLESSKDVWNVNLLAQRASIIALQDEDYRLKSIELIEEEREFVEMRLGMIQGIEKVFKPSVNFILFRLNRSAKNLLENLRSKNILLRSCENFPTLDDRFVRMAIRSHDENLIVIESIENFLEDEDVESVEDFWSEKLNGGF